MRHSAFRIMGGVAAAVLIVTALCWRLGAAEKAEFGDDFHYFPASDERQQKLDELVGKFLPTYIAVDRNGIVRAAGVRPDKVEQVVKALLAEKAK